MTMQNIRILHIDDDDDYIVLTKDLLSTIPDMTYIIDWKMNYDDGLSEIKQHRHDIYLIDYNLGKKNGLELAEEALASGCRTPIILLTGEGERQIDLAAIGAGVDDYLEKDDLNAKFLERAIRNSIERKKLMWKLQDSLDKIKTLNGLLPICASCKKIRDDKGYWNKLEAYIQSHSNAEFSHGICPECYATLYQEFDK